MAGNLPDALFPESFGRRDRLFCGAEPVIEQREEFVPEPPAEDEDAVWMDLGEAARDAARKDPEAAE